MLTVYGIETKPLFLAASYLFSTVATVLTVYGIETLNKSLPYLRSLFLVATVLTVYGIETHGQYSILHFESLQQCLPFTVLKQVYMAPVTFCKIVATVLTVYGIETNIRIDCLTENFGVATVLTVYGIETFTLKTE